MTIGSLLVLWIGMTTGHILMQFLVVRDDSRSWARAIDRAFFQGVTLIVVWLIYGGQQ